MNEQTDEEVALQVQRGDKGSFGVLVERYGARLMRYAKKFLLDRDDTQDLVQEVFIRVYRNIKSFDATRRFSSWIYRIAHNEFVNAIRKRSRDPLQYFDLDVLFPHLLARETADRDANIREMREALDHSLVEIDEKYREPLILYFYEEMSYQEISDILRIPVSTVGVRLTRGKVALKNAYQKINGD